MQNLISSRWTVSWMETLQMETLWMEIPVHNTCRGKKKKNARGKCERRSQREMRAPCSGRRQGGKDVAKTHALCKRGLRVGSVSTMACMRGCANEGVQMVMWS